MNFLQLGWEEVDLVKLVQDNGKFWALLQARVNLFVP